MLKKVFGLCMLVGFILMIGTAGSSDLGVISTESFIIRMCLSVFLIVAGFIGLKLNDWEYID